MPRKASPSIAPSANRSTNPPPDTDQARAVALSVRIVHITASPTNPRKNFDDAKLAELAESIRSKGVLQPILVRPLYTNNNSRDRMCPDHYWRAPANWPAMEFELVAGERRYRAANLAGLTEIPAIVRDLTDLQVLEIQVIENEQREDVSPMEKAEGYARLVDEHKVPVEDLATRVGKSPATIYGLLKLRALSPEARAAVDAGTISLSIAQLIARIPGQETRDDALRYALEPDYAGSVATYRDMQKYVARECMIELKQAPFDRSAPDLTSAGACTNCPKLTGNNPTEYPDSRADICLDPACFRAKEAAHREAVLAEAKDQGRTILKGKAAEEALSYRSTYYNLADTCYEITKPKTFAKLVGKELREKTAIAVDDCGRIHQLVAKKDALPLLKEKHGLAKHVAANGQTKSKADVEFKRQEKETRALEKLGLAAVVAKAETLFGSAATLGMGPPQEAFLRAVCKQAAAVAWSETRRHLVARRQIPLDNSKSQYERLEKSLDAYIATLGKTQLFGLLAEIVCSREFHGGAYNSGEGSKRILLALDIDPAKIAADVKAELNGKSKPAKFTAGAIRIVEPEAADPNTCRVCHCTEEKFRPAGAYWVEPNLCSACVTAGAEPITDDGKAQAVFIRRAAESRGEKAKPYGWEIVLDKHDGERETIHLVAPTEKQARRLAMLKPLAARIESLESLTKEQYHRTYGSKTGRD